MKEHKTFEVHPPNSEKNVKEMVEVNFNPIGEKMPDLLSEFIKLLGNEKEEWGGVAAMKACRNEFFKECPKLEDTVPTYKDLEEFLFSPNRYVPIFDQGPGRPSTSKAVIQGVVDPPASPKPVKAPDRPSTSTAVIPDVVDKTHVLPANPKTLKVKIYMGSGWIKDFPELGSRPSLFVNLNIDGGESHKTKVHKKSMTPCWGEEFVFPLSNPKDAKLIVEVYDHSRRTKAFAGKISLLVSELEPRQGIHVIPLSNQAGNPCSSAWLVVRFMFV